MGRCRSDGGDSRRRMGELAQLPWWQRLRWRFLRRLLQPQQLQARALAAAPAGCAGCADPGRRSGLLGRRV